VNAHLVLAVLAVIARRGGWLYLRPFGPCPKCKGAGHIQRGRRRPVCPRCKGQRRIQRRGSRTVHRLAFRIRDGQGAAARYQQQEDNHGTP
jgi:DnaJ-class molecular chaperone